ncbi:hypothetical protein M3Y98_00061600 [Aphelenchoides besseyi]|nr:hypothetical protein M3Y98_00061600 [Aphelenchoides besseyi]
MASVYCYTIMVLGILIPSIIFVYFSEEQINRITSRSMFHGISQMSDPTSDLSIWIDSDKLIFMDDTGQGCGGLGNMLFRLASLHGISKQLNRSACFQGSCAEEYRAELYSMFPNLQKYPLKNQCSNESAKTVNFAEGVWNYDNMSKLNQHNDEKYIYLRTSYLQSHKFFHYARRDVLFMFDFNPGVHEMIDLYAQQLFGNNNSVNICVHMRSGDFNNPKHPLLPTDDTFLLAAVEFLSNSITQNQSNQNVDVLLLSSEFKYASDIKEKIKRLNVTNKILMARELNRIENINLAARHCNYMLLTCSGSTFGWWMSYLMPEEKQQNVYYNSLLFKSHHQSTAATFYEEDFFPSAWNRLVLNKEKTEVSIEDRRKPHISV